MISRVFGVGLTLVAMALFWRAIGWPAPAVSAAIGYGAYRLVRAEG